MRQNVSICGKGINRPGPPEPLWFTCSTNFFCVPGLADFAVEILTSRGKSYGTSMIIFDYMSETLNDKEIVRSFIHNREENRYCVRELRDHVMFVIED